MKIPFLALLSIAMSVAAQFFLKAGMRSAAAVSSTEQASNWSQVTRIAFNPQIIAGFALYGLGAIVWLTVLAKWDVSKAYPMVGLGFLGTLAIGYLTGETVSIHRIGGVLLICAGVLLVGRS